MKENKFFKSMSRKGTCLDNASMGSFFHLMKTEMMFKKYQSKEELIDEMKEWIRYYNKDRIKTKLKGKSPIEYRKFTLEKILILGQVLGIIANVFLLLGLVFAFPFIILLIISAVFTFKPI